MKIDKPVVNRTLFPFQKSLKFVSFTADVFMCECRQTGSDVCYWNLRLLNQGTLVDAFHWDNSKTPLVNYQSNDSVCVLGYWRSRNKERFQVLSSELINRLAANDYQYELDEPVQLAFDFNEETEQGGASS